MLLQSYHASVVGRLVGWSGGLIGWLTLGEVSGVESPVRHCCVDGIGPYITPVLRCEKYGHPRS